MARSTTATTTFPLLKYSRSYPPGHGQSTPGTEWQHFTNPVLQLALDITKTENAELRSVRLRVIWTIQNGGVITMNDNSEIVLEDVDLLAFSSLSPRQGALMNIPLKAVYRESTVGMRYLHPLSETNTTAYRRFQISFTSNQDTNAFINSIRMVCPCKMSPGPSVPQQQQNTNTMDSGISGCPPPVNSQNPMLGVPPRASQVPRARALESQLSLDGQAFAREYAQPHGNTVNSAPAGATVAVKPSTMPPPVVPPQPLRQVTSSADLEGTDTGSQNLGVSVSKQPTQSFQTSSQTLASSQIPTQVQQVDTDQQTRATTNQNEETASHPIFSALNEATTIYNLPAGVLEHVVGDVIREDGFIQLVEKLEQLWKIKSLVVNHPQL